MTVSSQNIDDIYTGDGATKAFSYTFKVFAATDIVVKIRTISTGAEVTKTLNADYTVSGVGQASGGEITLTGTAPQPTENVVIFRTTPVTQGTDYIENDAFLAESHEDALDRLTLINQEQAAALGRMVQGSVGSGFTGATFTEKAADRASKFMGFDSSGNFVIKDVTDSDRLLGKDVSGSPSADNFIIFNASSDQWEFTSEIDAGTFG